MTTSNPNISCPKCGAEIPLPDAVSHRIREKLALDLFSHEILQVGHFESRHGGVYLNDAGRRKFFLQYERRMERQFMSESAGHRTTLRLQLENQAVLFKAALDDPDRFEPFLMN